MIILSISSLLMNISMMIILQHNHEHNNDHIHHNDEIQMKLLKSEISIE
jgi:hypothetical protein